MKLDGVEEVTAANEDGTIAVASSRCRSGAAFGSPYAERYLHENAGLASPDARKAQELGLERISVRMEDKVSR